MGFEQLHMAGLFCIKNTVFLRNCDPYFPPPPPQPLAPNFPNVFKEQSMSV